MILCPIQRFYFPKCLYNKQAMWCKKKPFKSSRLRKDVSNERPCRECCKLNFMLFYCNCLDCIKVIIPITNVFIDLVSSTLDWPWFIANTADVTLFYREIWQTKNSTSNRFFWVSAIFSHIFAHKFCTRLYTIYIHIDIHSHTYTLLHKKNT